MYASKAILHLSICNKPIQVLVDTFNITQNI